MLVDVLASSGLTFCFQISRTTLPRDWLCFKGRVMRCLFWLCLMDAHGCETTWDLLSANIYKSYYYSNIKNQVPIILARSASFSLACCIFHTRLWNSTLSTYVFTPILSRVLGYLNCYCDTRVAIISNQLQLWNAAADGTSHDLVNRRQAFSNLRFHRNPHFSFLVMHACRHSCGTSPGR